MPPSQFRPFGELVLRAGRVHFSFELDDISLELGIFTGVFGDGDRKSQVESP